MPAAAAASSKEDAADIIAMAAASKAQSKPTASASASTGRNNSSNTDALARSNLLRLETCELLKESILHIHPTTISNSLGDGSGGVRAHEEAKWAPSVRDYLDKITQVITSLDETTLSPSVALLPNSNSAGTSGKDAATSPEYRIPLLSDKFHKSLLPITSGKEKSVADHRDNPLTTWSFPFHGGPSLSLVPIGSFGHLGNAGLANRHANGGNVVPVLDVAVLVDNTHNVASPFVGGKDYLNHRYTDVSC